MTRALAKELGPRHIRVNAINPGVVETEGVHAASLSGSDFEKQAQAQTPLGRIGQPDDIAPAVVFLASPGAAWITGETLSVSGGAPLGETAARRSRRHLDHRSRGLDRLGAPRAMLRGPLPPER